MTCWPKSSSAGGHKTYYLYNQANPYVPIEDRGPCKSLSSQYKTAHLRIKEEVNVGCGLFGNLGENSINVTLLPLNGELIDHETNC